MYKYPIQGAEWTLGTATQVTVMQITANEKLFRVAGLVPVDHTGAPHPDPNHWECWQLRAHGGVMPSQPVTLPAGLVLRITYSQHNWTPVTGGGGAFGARMKVVDAPDKRWRKLTFWLPVKELYRMAEYPCR